jgi:hypothetical protein
MGAVICELPHIMSLLAIVLGHIIGAPIGIWIVNCFISWKNDE